MARVTAESSKRERGQRVARGRSTMGITSSTPDVPSAAGTEREERRSSLASPNEGPAANGPRRVGSGARVEEDWVSMATGDPAFWIKD